MRSVTRAGLGRRRSVISRSVSRIVERRRGGRALVPVAGEEQQQRVAAELQQRPAVVVRVGEQPARSVTPMTSVTCSAPTVPETGEPLRHLREPGDVDEHDRAVDATVEIFVRTGVPPTPTRGVGTNGASVSRHARLRLADRNRRGQRGLSHAGHAGSLVRCLAYSPAEAVCPSSSIEVARRQVRSAGVGHRGRPRLGRCVSNPRRCHRASRRRPPGCRCRPPHRPAASSTPRATTWRGPSPLRPPTCRTAAARSRVPGSGCRGRAACRYPPG